MSAVKLEVLKTDRVLDQEEAVKVLEKALEMAKRGEFSQVVILASSVDNKSWKFWKSRSSNYLETVGMLEHAKFDILHGKEH